MRGLIDWIASIARASGLPGSASIAGRSSAEATGTASAPSVSGSGACAQADRLKAPSRTKRRCFMRQKTSKAGESGNYPTR